MKDVDELRMTRKEVSNHISDIEATIYELKKLGLLAPIKYLTEALHELDHALEEVEADLRKEELLDEGNAKGLG
jgi:seryl-tRNA synthetase